MKTISSLDDLMNGAAVERFNKCLKEVLNNIFDPNTDAKKTRKITMTLTIKPDKSRNSAKFYLDVRSGLAPDRALRSEYYAFSRRSRQRFGGGIRESDSRTNLD